MILAYLLLLTGLTISSVAIYYSVVGLTAIFSAAAVPIMIMGVSLEVAKLVCATWIKQYWTQVPRLMKTYMCIAITVLMLITSMGIFGFLSKAHNDQNLVSGDVGAKLAIYDEKIKTARDNIEADRKQLQQMDAAVDQVMTRSTNEQGADKANAIRNSQKRDRAQLAKDIETNQKIISKLNDEAAPIRAENRKVEAEVGPIKYVAAFIYGVTPDAGMLERAVTWIIIMIVIVFDPLAVIMLLASQMTFAWKRAESEETDEQAHKRIESELAETMHDLGIVNTPLEEPKTKMDFEGIRMPDGTWIQTGPSFEVPESKAYEQDDGPLSGDQIKQINELVANNKPEKELEYFVIEDADDEEDHPYRGQGQAPSMPMQASYIQPKPEEIVEEVTDKPKPYTMVERPGDYVEPPLEFEPTIDITPPRPENPEAAPAPGRGIMHTHLLAEADNVEPQSRPVRSDFGNLFPINPEKGDTYLRTDYLPNRLFKYNGFKWIEVDKSSTDVYAYEEAYIRHLIEEIEAGRYDPDALTDVEREQIAEYLGKNEQ